MEIHCNKAPNLNEEQEKALDLHSILNNFNVLQGQFYILGLNLSDDPDQFKSAIDSCQAVAAEVAEKGIQSDLKEKIHRLKARIIQCLQEEAEEKPEVKAEPEFIKAWDNLESVFEIFFKRAGELVDRLGIGQYWKVFSISVLYQNFREVFQAIEKNSGGRYHIVYDPSRQLPEDYLIEFHVDSHDKKTILMPPVFQDVMGDLMANARKYTPPGGSIVAAFRDDGKALHFVVKDTGQGIPADELEQVTEYGYRASNTNRKRTMGGGFGLTKALYVVKQYGGQMWIDSEVDVGTRITIEIPRPSDQVVS